MKSIIKAIFSSIVAILSKIAKFFLSIPSWLVSLFKTIGSFFMICLLWVKRLLLSGWSKTKSLFAKARSIRKPSWFQWNIFPKDGQPPTQSLFEIVIYLICLWFCVDLFIDFNKIPNSFIFIEADKLNDYRYLSVDTFLGKPYLDFHHLKADLKVQIPMNTSRYADFENISAFEAYIYNMSMEINDPVPCDGNNRAFRTKSNLDPYMTMIYEIAAKRSGFTIYDEKIDSIRKLDNHWEHYFNVNNSYDYIKTYYDEIKEMIPDSISNEICNYYRFQIAYNTINNKTQIKDTSWITNLADSSLFDNIILDENNNEILKCYQFFAYKEEELLSEYLNVISYEYYDCNNFSEDQLVNYISLCKNRGIAAFYDEEEYHPDYHYRAIPLETFVSENKNAIGFSGIFDRYDISQGWYNIYLSTSTIDQIELTIDFLGATDFYPMKIEPDERGSNYIKYTDPIKILKIKEEGLTFYAKFKEMENKQTIRCFAVTALISGLIIIILTFFILGLYRTLKVFGNYLFKNRNLQ